MKLLFLRGSVPADRDPQQIVFDRLEDCDDMWSQLAYRMLEPSDYGEIWYWGGKRNHKFADNYTERWIKDFKQTKHDFKPNVIICRGGFPQFDHVMGRNPGALKIYYGAGKRFFPVSNFKNYDIILVDSLSQQEIVRSKFKCKCEVFVKPAADNVFYPVSSEKKYDVVFAPNMYSPRKRCEFFLSSVPESVQVVVAGKVGKSMVRRKNLTYIGWVTRSHMRSVYAQSKIAVCPSSGGDSCPRVIPESLACDVPVLVSSDVNLWQDKYINAQTGKIASLDNFFEELEGMLSNYLLYEPRAYYEQNLSLNIAAQGIKNLF